MDIQPCDVCRDEATYSIVYGMWLCGTCQNRMLKIDRLH